MGEEETAEAIINNNYRVGEITPLALKGASLGIWTASLFHTSAWLV